MTGTFNSLASDFIAREISDLRRPVLALADARNGSQVDDDEPGVAVVLTRRRASALRSRSTVRLVDQDRRSTGAPAPPTAPILAGEASGP
jgi:hypothetical protein